MHMFEWNTQRLYTANGQRIRAYVADAGWVAFVDRDRLIAGIVRGHTAHDRGCEHVRARVMAAYDANVYDWARTEEEQQAIYDLEKA